MWPLAFYFIQRRRPPIRSAASALANRRRDPSAQESRSRPPPGQARQDRTCSARTIRTPDRQLHPRFSSMSAISRRAHRSAFGLSCANGRAPSRDAELRLWAAATPCLEKPSRPVKGASPGGTSRLQYGAPAGPGGHHGHGPPTTGRLRGLLDWTPRYDDLKTIANACAWPGKWKLFREHHGDTPAGRSCLKIAPQARK